MSKCISEYSCTSEILKSNDRGAAVYTCAINSHGDDRDARTQDRQIEVNKNDIDFKTRTHRGNETRFLRDVCTHKTRKSVLKRNTFFSFLFLATKAELFQCGRYYIPISFFCESWWKKKKKKTILLSSPVIIFFYR